MEIHTLRDILLNFDLDYDYIDNREIAIIDFSNRNINNIEEQRFTTVDEVLKGIEQYIEIEEKDEIDFDLYIDGHIDDYTISCLSLKEKVNLACSLNIPVMDYYFAIINPESIIIEEELKYVS
jgi:hypothetical protein